MAKMKSTGLNLALDDAKALAVLGEMAGKLRRAGKFEEAVCMAINEAIVVCEAEAIKAVREEFNVSREVVRSTMRVHRATKRSLRAELRGRGKMSAELVSFGAKESSRGVTVKVLKSSRREIVTGSDTMPILRTKKKNRPRTWIAKGHVLAMTDRDTNPIRILWGPGFVSRLSNEDIRNRVLQKGIDKLEKRMAGIARYALGKDG